MIIEEQQLRLEKNRSFIKGVGEALELNNTLKALHIGKMAHINQKRKSNNEPYFIHPLRVCRHLFEIGVKNDACLASALLHDVLEDTELTTKDLKDLRINDETIEIVLSLTCREKTEDYLNVYYKDILKNPNSVLVKVSDRCDNISTMYGAWKNEKILKYIEETEKYIFPLIDNARVRYPEIANKLYSMYQQIKAVTFTVSGILREIEREKTRVDD